MKQLTLHTNKNAKKKKKTLNQNEKQFFSIAGNADTGIVESWAQAEDKNLGQVEHWVLAWVPIAVEIKNNFKTARWFQSPFSQEP